MTVLIKMPGTLDSTTGLRRLMPTNNGFPEEGLTDLMLFADGSGTTPDNSVSGGSAGLIEHPVATNNAISWLTGGGGIELQGTEIVTMPAIAANAAWTLVHCGSVTGSVSSGTERLTGLLGFRGFSGSPSTPRGATLYMRGGTNWNIVTTSTYHESRAWETSAQGAVHSSATGSLVDRRLVRFLSYNGTNAITASVYDKDGALVHLISYSVDETAMLTNTTLSTSLQPTVGLSNGTFTTGIQEVEAYAAYDRVLATADITRVCAAAAALGTARSRVWS